jgi:Leucine-rich repeat (LRR) protein
MVISDLLAFITVADQLEFIPALIFAASQFLKTKSLCNNVIQKINSGQLGLAVRDGISGYLLNGEEIKMNEAPENWKFSLQDCLNYRPQTLRFDKETRKKMISTEIKISDLAGLENIPNKEMIIELYLDANKIATIPAGNFMGFNNLRTLVLEHNKITRITAQNFEGLSNLQGLYLSHNQIKHIEPQAFAGLPNLQEVVLDHNEITQIPIQAFALPNKLRSLYLNYNLISQIPAQAFVKLNALQELHLCGNQISCVQGWALKGLTNLQKLHLSLNPIKEISIQAFKNLNNLQEAYFFRTKLSQKQENELRNALPNLRIDF